MPIATGLAIGLGVASAAAGIGGAAIGAHAAGKAADAQVSAANHAADLQHQDAQQALDFQKQQYATSQKNMAPWLQAGTSAIGTLSGLMGPGGELAQGWNQKFEAPTDVTEQNDPGYKFRLSEGLNALQNSAAARGGLLSSGTAKNINDYAQNSASQEYGNVYNRALGQYQQNYNIFENNQANKFNRYASLAGVGQQAANQLSGAGQNASNNVSNILLTSGQQIGNNINNAAAARASGYVGGANAYGSALTGGVNDITQSILLSQLMKGQGSGSNLPAYG